MKPTNSAFICTRLRLKAIMLTLGAAFFASGVARSQCFTYTVVACVDGRSWLHIAGDQLWWEHLNFDPPGTHNDCPGPVTVNGNPWVPWNSNYTLPNSTTGCSLVANVLQCPDVCVVIQAPTAANNWEAIYDFNDIGPSGPHTFVIELQYFCPTADAGPDQLMCAGESVDLTATGGVSYSWSPPNGLSCVNCPNPTATPNSTTTYTVTATDVNGCSDTDDVTVTVNNLPVASFSAGQMCAGEPVQFTDNSTGNPDSWLWDFGDGSVPDQNQNPTHTYAQPGNYEVILGVSANGCFDVDTVPIVVPSPILVNVSGTDPTCYGMEDGSVDLTVNGGTSPYTFSWSNGSTLEDPANLGAGTSYVDVTDANGCTVNESVVLNEPTPVYPNAYQTFVSLPGVCDGGGISNPTGGTPPYTFSWSAGQTTQNATGLCEGPQTITVTDANGCTGTQTITVSAPACLTDVDFYTWVQAGQPANGNWVVESAGAQVRQTINGNPTFFVTPSDYINVRMRGKMRTTDDDDDWMGVVFGFKDPLGASNDFDMWLFDWKQETQNGGREGFALSHAVGTITNYAPTFWDHTNTPEFTVVATNYGNNGWNRNVNYEVEVTYTINRAVILVDGDTIFDVYDCFEPGRFGFYNYSQRQVIYSDFTYELFADFIVETPQICAGDTAEFTFLEQCGNFNNLSQFDELQWDFGDGATEANSNLTVANVNPTHVYQAGGNYTVQLIALDTLGCRDTIYKDITVYQNPTADFTFSGHCFQDLTQFTDGTTQGDFAVTGWNWSFGDGGTDTQADPTHTYGAPNNYTVRLIAQDSYGCVDTVEQTLEIYVLPQTDFTPIDDCYSTDYPFTDQSTIVNGTVDGWEWDFGDGANSTQQNPIHTYGVFGTYDVQLVATSDQGCSDTLLQSIVLHDNPLAGFEIPNICQLEPMQFLDTSSIQEGSIVSWHYTFGDGASSTDQDPWHTYADDGSVTVTLTATSDLGCIGTTATVAMVNPKPEADFETVNVCLNDPVLFTDQSTVAGGSVVSWEWDLGDGTLETVQHPSNNYATFGTYAVELMVETDEGCRDTIDRSVEVYQLPVANFNFADVCLDAEAQFTDLSTSNSGAVDTWNWDLGDGTLENGQGPITHHYPAPADYNVALVVETDLGCSDTLEQTITIHPMPVADFVADSVCFGQITSFTDQSSILSGTIASYVWDFGFSASSSIQNPNNIFPETGYLPVSLTLTSDFGCKDTVTEFVRIYVLPEPQFSHNDTCFEDHVYFNDQSSIAEGTIDLFDWNFGDGNGSTLQQPSHYYTAAGIYQATQVLTSNFGCLDSISHQVEIYPLPEIAFTALPAEGCQPLTVTFNNESTIENDYFISMYQWDFGQGLSSSELHPQTVYADSGLYDVMLIATTTNGCDDTLLVSEAINVWPRPVAGFMADEEEYTMFFPEVELNDESFGATEWHWDFGDGSQSFEQHPTHEYMDAGTYVITQTVNNDHGCDDVETLRIVVRPAITLYIPNGFTPNADGINDDFSPDGVGIEEFQMSIFDRWGENLFHTASLGQGWDGSYKGREVESGMYVYRITIVDVNKEYREYTGEVFLVR